MGMCFYIDCKDKCIFIFYTSLQGPYHQLGRYQFRQFLQDFPDGRYAPNAHYWLGELYLVIEPRDLESARQSFALLVSQHPEHNKTPDALYKLGKVQFEKGNPEKARVYFDLVINQYSGTNASVADLARTFIAENY